MSARGSRGCSMSAAPSETVSARASFSDGRTATAVPARARLERDALIVADERGTTLETWPLAEVKLIDRIGREGAARFTRLPEWRARLTVYEPALVEALIARRPDLARGGRSFARGSALFALGTAVVLALAVAGLPYATPLLAHLVPASLERRLGEATLAEIARTMRGRYQGGLCIGSNGAAALDRLAQRLASATGGTPAADLLVIDAEVENAFALPGGKVVILRGLIERMLSPDELSGVLAHELAHLALDHPTQSLVEAVGLDALISLMAGGGAAGTLGDAGRLLIRLAHSRGQEAEADRMALATLQAAGLRADGTVRLFERWARHEGGPTFLGTHPASPERKALFAAAGAGGASALDPAEWRAVREICARLERVGG